MFSSLPKTERGHVFDIPGYISRLMRSADARAFLTIRLAGSDDFLQMTGGERGVQLDFPMITPRQRSFEAKVRESVAGQGLAIVENYGSDGARFLDIEVEGTPQAVAAVCSKMLRAVYSVPGDAELIFQHAGLAHGDA